MDDFAMFDFELRLCSLQFADILPSEVFHYTDAQGLVGIITDQKLRATHYQYMNDPRELIAGESAVRKALESFPNDEFINRFIPDLGGFFDSCRPTRNCDSHFILSFSDKHDELDQWYRYGDHCQGYALGFAVHNFSSDAPEEEEEFLLTKCQYSSRKVEEIVHEGIRYISAKTEQKFGNDLASLGETGISRLTSSVTTALESLLASQALCHKEQSFKGESEWRMILSASAKPLQRKYRPVGSMIRPYVEVSLGDVRTLSISRIVIGPAGESQVRKRAVEMLLSDNNLASCSVAESELVIRV